MIAIRNERLADFDARETLLDRAYGPARFTKTSARLREDRLLFGHRDRVIDDEEHVELRRLRERPAVIASGAARIAFPTRAAVAVTTGATAGSRARTGTAREPAAT